LIIVYKNPVAPEDDPLCSKHVLLDTDYDGEKCEHSNCIYVTGCKP
jgi:hypothetical protein